MAKNYKYNASGIPSSDSIIRIRANAIKAIERDPYAYNPVNIYTKSYTLGIYPFCTVKLMNDGRFMCRTGEVWKEIDRKGNLKG